MGAGYPDVGEMTSRISQVDQIRRVGRRGAHVQDECSVYTQPPHIVVHYQLQLIGVRTLVCLLMA